MYNNYGGYNPYMTTQPRFQQPMQLQSDTQYVPQTPQYGQQSGLQGKQVDSIEVVKATDIPFTGISYFPLTDGSAIVTKQIQIDGTCKLVVFRPDNEQKEEIRYLTKDDLKVALDELNIDKIDDFEDELKEFRKELKELKKK